MRKSRKQLILLLKDVEYCCKICGQGPEWQGKPLVLQIDHIDGNSENNSIENLRFLCPQCHSQTETWGSKKLALPRFTFNCAVCDKPVNNVKEKHLDKRKYCSRRCSFIGNMAAGKHKVWQEKQKTKIDWPTKEKLEELLSMYSCREVGRMLGVSDSAIRKRLKLLS